MFVDDEYDYELDALEDGKSLILNDVKNGFLKKIYSLLSLQLVFTWSMSYLFYKNKDISNFVLSNPGALVTASLGTFLFLFLSWCYGKKYPANYLILSGFTICESYLVSYICLFYQPISVLLAWGLTATIFVSLSLYVIVTGKDFSFLGAGLFAGLTILILGGFIQIIWLPNDQVLNTSMSCLGALIATGYILYDTSNIINRLDPDDYIYACMSLYIDIIMLFIRILELFGNKKE